ncbi:hypothetical protein FCM35_KLT04659 [Carex littledalei]|uniref:CWZF3/5/7 THD domain-containing protein n=1 Tax=Carex littledalei TaxID=544730 RepID=A0A833QWB6_9POAL|nr:hypothetical protein FCM35_KLT04659 [Carex littledalei]
MVVVLGELGLVVVLEEFGTVMVLPEIQGNVMHNTVDQCARPVSRPSRDIKQNVFHRPPLAPTQGCVGKPNPENIQDKSKCVQISGKEIREDKGVGPYPKKSNMGDYSFSGLHQIPPGFLPSPSHACIKPETRDGRQIKSCILVPSKKRAMDIAPCTPKDNKEQKVQFVTVDNILRPEKMQGKLKQAMAIHKEAEDLEQRAYRFKKTGQDKLSAELYFEAAIKFLHAAYIFEPVNLNNIKPGDADESVKLYIHAGKMCKYVALIFQHWMHVVPAGLAYKCTEVAFMKVGFYKNLGTSKDNHNLNIALRNQFPGEFLSVLGSSPSSNIPPSLCRVLDYVNIMNSAFEGTRGYERAFRDAENGTKDISLLKEALNLGCQNMELLLHTVRRALASSPC